MIFVAFDLLDVSYIITSLGVIVGIRTESSIQIAKVEMLGKYGLEGVYLFQFFTTVTIVVLSFIHSLAVPYHFPLQLPHLVQ